MRRAQDATWRANPGTNDFDTATNWNPTQVPAGTASFGMSGTTKLSFSTNTTVGGFTFNVGASDFTFSNDKTLTFNGAGIIINGGSATINNNSASGVLIFDNSSKAGSAHINNNSTLKFADFSTAENATITNNSGGTTFFIGAGNGGTARFIMNGTGALDISQFSTKVAITAGSIEGNGNVFLGDHVLTVGDNNLSTTFSGVIQDGGFGGGTLGSLVKRGSGTLILSGTNTYTGATIVTPAHSKWTARSRCQTSPPSTAAR